MFISEQRPDIDTCLYLDKYLRPNVGVAITRGPAVMELGGDIALLCGRVYKQPHRLGAAMAHVFEPDSKHVVLIWPSMYFAKNNGDKSWYAVYFYFKEGKFESVILHNYDTNVILQSPAGVLKPTFDLDSKRLPNFNTLFDEAYAKSSKYQGQI